MDPLSGIEQKKVPNLTKLQDNQTNKLPNNINPKRKKHALKHTKKTWTKENKNRYSSHKVSACIFLLLLLGEIEKIVRVQQSMTLWPL